MSKLNIEIVDFNPSPNGEYTGYLKANNENLYFNASLISDRINVRQLDKEGIFSVPMDKFIEENIQEVKDFVLDKMHTHAIENDVYEKIKPYQPEESFVDLQSICGSKVLYNKEPQIYSIIDKSDLDYIKYEKFDKKYKTELSSLPKPDTRQEITEEKEFDLKDTLESFAGSLCYVDKDPDLDNIMEYGQFWLGKDASLIKGNHNECHWNSCRLWQENQDSVRICTGYALSDDGLWRSHTWAVKLEDEKTQLIETTTKRKAYFGVVLPTENCAEFYKRLIGTEPQRLQTWKAKTPDIVNKYNNNHELFTAIKEVLGEINYFSLEEKLATAEEKAASQNKVFSTEKVKNNLEI